MQAGGLLERSADLLSAVAAEQPRPRSGAAIRQSDLARLVCRPGSAHLSERILDLPDVFSAVRRAGLHGRVLLERSGELEEAPAYSGCARRSLGQARIVGAVGGAEGRLVLHILWRQRH